MIRNTQILVVEDEGIIASDIQRTLEKYGYSVLAVVSSGEEALEKAGVYRPDLILMDISLEGNMDGIEAAAQIKSHFNIPIVYITGKADKHTIDRAKQTDPAGYLIKPFDERTLSTAVELALYRNHVTSESMNQPNVTQGLTLSKGNRMISTSQKGLPEGWTRATFIIRKDLLDKIKAIAYWDRKTIKVVLEEALDAYMQDKEVLPIKEEVGAL
jgi:CheY-like chemotaxis protein